MPELLPCPFCGKPPKVEMTDFYLGGRTIRCETDDCMGPHTTAANADDAAIQWNARQAAAPQGREALERLEVQFDTVAKSYHGYLPDAEAGFGTPDSLTRDALIADATAAFRKAIDELRRALTPAVVPDGAGEDYRETVKILLDLLNPLHGSLDRQVSNQLTDEREIEPPRDREYNVDITVQQERDLTQAICILENRRTALAQAQEPGEDK